MRKIPAETLGCFLALIGLLAVDGAAGRGAFHNMRKAMEQVRALQKSGPQPRATQVTELLKVRPSEILEPSQTVLHYCDPIACCGLEADARHWCEPTVEPVTLFFRATDVMKKEKRIVQHEFQNHTSCTCHHLKYLKH